MANKQSSKRERHFRRVLAQSNCVGWAHDPDLSGDMHPYWLKKQVFTLINIHNIIGTRFGICFCEFRQ